MEKISIIIPVFNSSRFLKRCIDSIINQTYKNLEIICINDGSLDDSLKILMEYQRKDDRIKVIDKENQGVSVARNKGMELASGDYIIFIDSDDWIEEDAIEKMYNALVKNNADVVRCNYCINYASNSLENKGDLFEWSNIKINSDILKTNFLEYIISGKIPCYSCLLLIKKSKINTKLEFKADIFMMEDMIFYVELINLIDNIYFLDEALYHYFYNDTSATKSIDKCYKNIFNTIKVREYLIDILKNNKLYSDERGVKLDTRILSIIFEYIFYIKKINIDKKEMIKYIKQISENKKIIQIYDNSNLTLLPAHVRIPIRLIMQKKYRQAYIFYSIRNVFSNFKNMLKGI